MKDKQFQDLIGKYLIINGQEPGFKIERIEPAPFEAYTSIIICEHNLILYMTDACIEMLREQNVIIFGGNNYSIMENPKDIENLFDKIHKDNPNVEKPPYPTDKKLSYKDIEIWKQRWWDLYFKLVVKYQKEWTNDKVIFVTTSYIERAMKEINGFFKNK